MKIKKWLPIVCIFILFIGFQSIESIFAQKNPKRLYIQNEKKKKISLKFRCINNLIIIPVQVNESDTLNFILDTGITNTILHTNHIVHLKPLKYSKDFIINGLGAGNYILAHHSPENKILINGILGDHQDLLVIDNNDLKLSNLLGIPVHGLIGFDLFKDLVVEINYDVQYITFHTHKTYRYKANKKKQISVPLWIEGAKPYIMAQISQADSTKLSIKTFLDLGASYSMWINQQALPGFKTPLKTTNAYLGQGLNGVVSGKIGKIPRVSIDRFQLNHVLISLPDSASTNFLGFENNRQASFGAEMLSRFNLIIDYRNQKLTLTPNGNFKRAFRYNMSGLEISALIPGKNTYAVSFIQPDSPAEKAGLEMGDIIQEIDGETLSKLSISEITNLLIQRPGKKIRIHYTRNDINKYTSFLLVDPL